MKRALNILLFLGIWSASAQEIKDQAYSVYFTEKALTLLKPISAITSIYFNKFQPKESEKNQIRIAAGEYLIIDASGIYLQKNKLLFITREQVREDSKYEVRDGYMFGVIENDSVPTALDGENYYFLIPAKTYLFDSKTTGAKLFEGRGASEFILFNREDNNHYTAVYIRFITGGVELMEPVLNDETCAVKNVKDTEVITGEFNTYIFSPTLKEWQLLFGCFVSYDEYVVVK